MTARPLRFPVLSFPARVSLTGTILLILAVASAVTQTDGSGDRLTAARMSVAGLVQTKGLARRLCSAM